MVLMKLAMSLCTATLSLASLATQLNAQILQANIAGSSAFWLEAGLGAYTQGGKTTTCAWTTTASGQAYVLDQRVPNVPQYFPFSIDNGPLWVTWTTGATGTCAIPSPDSQVWAYISLDSVLGDRCLFAQPQCTLNTKAVAGDGGANALPGITDSALPGSVLSAFNGQLVSIAATDILPVDAKFATYTTLADCGRLSKGTQFIGLGYGPGPIASTQIYSKFSVEYLNINDFSVYGFDPATGTQVPPYTITPVGAIPVVVAVNTINPAGFGSPQITNFNRGELGLFFTALYGRTADAIKQPFAGTGATYYGVSALIPAPLSGSYNIFEHSIANGKELYRSQDIANCDPYGSPTTNPLITTRQIGGTTSYRYRVIGTTETLYELQTVQDSIGYELWSAENFTGVTSIKYVTVDGIDPLQDTYTDGTLPQGTALANVTLSHVADGTYPIWNEERFISFAAGAPSAATLAGYVQAQVSFGAGATHPDFIPDQQLNVFHSHFAPFGVNFNATNTAADGPKVCGAGSNPEDGGDVGGMVLSLQAGADYCVLKGNYAAAGGVGPTNVAEFGVRQ
jgi:hypothetical protein